MLAWPLEGRESLSLPSHTQLSLLLAPLLTTSLSQTWPPWAPPWALQAKGALFGGWVEWQASL